MSLRNLTASNKTHRILINKLKDKKIFQIYEKFEKEFRLKDDFLVAVSGGPDSLALAFLTKIYAIKNSIKAHYFLVDHKLRKNSSEEAKFVKNLLKDYLIKLNVLKWNGKKPIKNIQSSARFKRYNLLIHQAKKLNIKNILLGHHNDDLIENFFIRMTRGSGLNGLVSFDAQSEYKGFNLIRPLLKFSKKDLIFTSKNIFEQYVEDPSNKNDKYKRTYIRNLIQGLQFQGFDKDKFNLTIKNLKFANFSMSYFVEKNIRDNSVRFNEKDSIFLNKNFFNQPEEIVFRSLIEIIKSVGHKYYPVRGKKINMIIELVNKPNPFKITLGNCLLKKVNNTIIVTKEA